MSGSTPRVASALVTLCMLGCGGTSSDPSLSESSRTTPAGATAAARAPVVDRGAPCTWVSPGEINATLGSAFGRGTETSDQVRQIVTCRYQQTSPFAILDIGLSRTSGADAYQTNRDLAPVYFDADAAALELDGADEAYIVRKADPAAWMIGLLVNGRFALVQVGVESAGEDGARALAGTIATRMR